MVWHRYTLVTSSKRESLHTLAWQQVIPDKPRPLAISLVGGSGEVIDGLSWLTGLTGEPVSVKGTGGADRRLAKSQSVRGKG
jgi:hypothetical protein